MAASNVGRVHHIVVEVIYVTPISIQHSDGLVLQGIRIQKHIIWVLSSSSIDAARVVSAPAYISDLTSDLPCHQHKAHIC